MSGLARADIGVNFNQPPGNNSVPPLAPTDVAGVGEYAQANYNNVSAIYPSQASNVVLNDHTGAATTATLTTTGAIFTAIAQLPTAGPDEAFNLGIAYSQSPWSWTVNDIPYASYDIIVYVPGLGLDRSDGNWGGVSIDGTTFYTKPPVYNNPGYFDGDPETPFPYVGPGPSDPVSLEYGTNYVQFSNLTGSSQTISISQQFIAATVGGFQIVGVPEPTTSATLLGLGLLGCGRAARRRRA
jgi:hypothetical protein